VTAVIFGPDGATVVSGSADGTVRIWGRRPDAPAVQIARVEPEQPVADASMTIELEGTSPSGSALSFQFRTSPGEDWRPASNARIRLSRLAVGAMTLEVRALDSQGRASPVVTRDWTVVERSPLLAWRELRVLRGHIGSVQAVRFSPDGDTVVSGSKDSTVRLWRLSDGLLRVSDGQTLSHTVLSSFDPGVRPTRAGSPEWQSLISQGLHALMIGGAVTSDGAVQAATNDDDAIVLRRVANGQPLRILRGDSGRVNDLAFNAGSTVLASASDDGTVRFWGRVANQPLRSAGSRRDR